MFVAPSSLVLRNRDLLDTIFEFFEFDERQELLWASLTSKAFLEPALNILWRVMISVFPLFQLLPEFNKDTLEFTTTVVHDKHIQPLLFYTRRIRELTFDCQAIAEYPDDIIFSIFNRLSKAAAFNSLRRLDVYPPRLEYNNHPFFMSMPNLEVLEVGAFPGIPISTFLYAISSVSRNLKSLNLWSTMIVKAVFDVLPCFRKLQNLDLGELDSHIPRSFLEDCASSMMSLQSLRIYYKYRDSRLIEDIGTPIGPSMALSPITFNSLSKLNLIGPHRDVENTLNILHVPQLVTLDLSLASRDDENLNIRPIMQGFLTSNGPYLKDQLRELSLRVDFRQLNTKDYLDSFQIFTRIDTLQIFAKNCFFLTSGLANLLHKGKFWSNLTVLWLYHPWDANRNRLADALSIAALPLLADSFPNLLGLEITIENPDQDAIKAIAVDNLRKAHGLESLDFLYVLPRDWIYSESTAVTFASFLHRLFPKLKTVECSVDKEWMMKVREMLKKKQNQIKIL